MREAERVTGLRGEAALKALVDEVEAMSVRFTRERPEVFEEYTETPLSCAGYGVYFFPQTFARMWHVLEMWRGKKGILPQSPLEVLDVGSGTGAAGMAVARWGALHGIETKVTAMDRSALAVETGRRLFGACRELWPKAEWKGIVGDLTDERRVEVSLRKWDLMVCSFVLNELGDEKEKLAVMRRMLEWVKDGGALIILEPAGEKSSGDVMALRDVLAGEGMNVVAPCLHQRACPMRTASSGFCHDVRRWRVPDSLEFVNRGLQRTLWDVKVSYLIVESGKWKMESVASPASSLLFRVVSPVTRTKAHMVTRGCCEDGTLREVELQCRGLTKEALREFDEWERGDLARMQVERLLGDGRTWRVAKMEKK